MLRRFGGGFVKALLVAIVSLVLLGAINARAETFDCQHPTTLLARLICNDGTLRAADAEENGLYDTALTASLDKAALRAEESAWFAAQIVPYDWYAQHKMPIANGEVIDTYHKRDDVLRQETQAWRKIRHGVSGATLAASCLALPTAPSSGCAVSAFASIEGTPSLRFQLQTYSQPPVQSAVIIFAAIPDQPDAWLPLAARVAKDATLSAPETIVSPFGTLLTVVSSGKDGSALYRLTPDALEDIDDRSWLDTLHAHLPDGLMLSPEITADYAKMQAVATTTRSQSSCCTVGSRAVIDLAIEDDRVVVKGITFDGPEGPPTQSTNE
jgi:hypothetical protein